MPKSEKVPINEAAAELGITAACLRERMRRGIYPIGLYIPKKLSGCKEDRFEVYRSKLDKFLEKDTRQQPEQDEEGNWIQQSYASKRYHLGATITKSMADEICAALNKLHAYESTGVSPEEIDAMQHKLAILQK